MLGPQRKMNTNAAPRTEPRILTNMVFWQSAAWKRSTCSIYPLSPPASLRTRRSILREAVALWRRSLEFDVVVTMGARESLAYGLLCAITGRPSKQIMCEVFLDEAQRANPLWRLKIFLYRRIARRAMGILTNSSAEIEIIARRFGIPTRRLRYVPMHSNISEPWFCGRNDGFVLSAGRTRRDYSSLLDAAPRIEAPVVILCGKHDLRDAIVPRGVTVLHEIPRKQYLDYLERCALVVLPLKAADRSTGQVVLLEAMALGKAVVATRSTGIQDYARDGENAVLLQSNEPEGMAREVNRLLRDEAVRTRLAEQALADVQRHYTFDIHARSKLQAIRDLCLAASERGV
jgi:glycosyltransferase involved in cell wall biosynthesis